MKLDDLFGWIMLFGITIAFGISFIDTSYGWIMKTFFGAHYNCYDICPYDFFPIYVVVLISLFITFYLLNLDKAQERLGEAKK